MTAPAVTSIEMPFTAPRGEINERCWLLALSGVVLLLSCVLGINTAGRVYPPPFDAFNLPTVCPSKLLFHYDCAGCGLTRAFVSLGHGQWRTALAYHPASPLIYGWFWLNAVAQIGALRRLKKGLPASKNRWLHLYGYVAVAALLLTGLSRWL